MINFTKSYLEQSTEVNLKTQAMAKRPLGSTGCVMIMHDKCRH